MDAQHPTPMGRPHAGVGSEKVLDGPESGGWPQLRARRGIQAGLEGRERSAAEVLEERADGQGIAPACEAGGRTFPREMVERVGEVDRWGEEEERSRRINIGCDRPQVGRLDGPPADAIIAAFGAVGRGVVVPGLTGGMPMLHAMTDLVRPAEEGAGQDEAGQKCVDETSHRENTPRKQIDPVLK